MTLTIRSNSDIDAAEAAASFRTRTDDQVAINVDISERLEQIQLSITDDKVPEPETSPLGPSVLEKSSEIDDLDTTHQAILGGAVKNSVTTRSWSVGSGISMAQMTVLAVINLPLYDLELKRFRQLVDLSSENGRAENVMRDETEARDDRDIPLEQQTGLQATSIALTGRHLRSSSPRLSVGALNSIQRQLRNFRLEPPPLCSAGPTGDDLVLLTLDHPYMLADRR
jgi:hypothetical protein